MQVFLISGKAQNGKDTVANLIQKKLQNDGYRVLITHYADLLKYVCKTYFGWDGNKDAQGRELLQYVGTDIIRTQHPDFWVDFIIQILKLFPDSWDYVIIPDCRFPNEALKIRESGIPTHLIRVRRSNFVSPLTDEQQRHPSETALDDFIPDSLIKNPGTRLDELNIIVADWVERNVYENRLC